MRIGTGMGTVKVQGGSHLLRLIVQTNLGDAGGVSVGIDDVFVGEVPEGRECGGVN